MASQKDKLLDSAQKAILKGQFDRAIKDYEQIIALEPKEMRHRQKLAELLARVNRNKDAVKEFEIIAKSYEAAGFYLKSIAVYKQIQKLDPKNLSVSLTLASLNEKQGLVGNALAEYKLVVEHYEASGNSAQAAGILERMLALDQDNLNIQLKLAETYFAAGMIDEAYKEFTKAVSALKTRGDHAAFEKVCKKMEGLFPGREFILDVVAAEIAGGDLQGAIERLDQVLKKNESNLKALKLLEDACAKSGNTAKRKQTLERMLRHFPNELSAKTGLIETALAAKDVESAIALLDKYGKDLVAGLSPERVEEYYKQIQEFAPYDTRYLSGLKGLYEATGNQAKLAEVTSRLSLAAAQTASAAHLAETAASEAATEVDFGALASSSDREFEAIETSIEDISVEVSAPPAPQEDSWEDVEISLPGEDEESFGVSLELPPEPVEEEVDIDSPLEVFEGVEPFAEDLDEIEMEPVDEDADVVNIDDLALTDTGHLFELSQELSDLADSAEQEAGGKLSKYSSSGVLSAFKKGVDQMLDKADTDTHYNLGIAYKEMGLYDDAISELKIAALDTARKMDCLTLKAICHREKGDYARAGEILTSLLGQPNVTDETVMSVKYELAQVYELNGKVDDAQWLYQEILGHDSGFRDVPQRLARLQGQEETLNMLGSDTVDIELEEVE